jgi:hypothetical protein
MNHIRRICRSVFGLPRQAGLLIASAAPAVLWADPPLPPGWNKYLPLPAGPQPAVRFPPSWNKHLPPPAHGHTVVIGGLPGWHTTFIMVTAAILAAAVIVILTRPRQPHAAPPAAPPEPPPTDITKGATPTAARPRP